ncbi:glutamyl-tRNA synthetase [Thraustotheca clavata]|uniref:glutamate--tRNA ligase n=1 Tax=Thraustotheca clavata TaxID=74557 RepID=A0A1W0ACM3_9STRA|nr:glutamyl-tRNA synthetase [Thraustotheca clavata]
MDASELASKIASQGALVRDLKAKKASKEEVTAAVTELLALKTSYKETTGSDYVDPNAKPKEKPKEKGASVAAAPADPTKKSKKELNKEAKKAKKAGIKGGEAAVTPAPKAAPVAAPAAAPSTKSSAPATVFVQPPPAATETHTIYFTQAHLPLISYVVATLLKSDIEIIFRPLTPPHALPVLVLPDGKNINGDAAIAKYLCRVYPDAGLYGIAKEPVLLAEIDSWVDYATGHIRSATLSSTAAFLDAVLAERTYLIGFGLTLADIAVFSALNLVHYEVNATLLPNLSRWFNFFAEQSVFASAKSTLQAIKPAPKAAPAAPKKVVESQKGKTSGNCPPLEGGVVGQVVTRFPPEPSGYLHIGHIKAALLNDYYARTYQGKLIVRFDDTNPSKEKDEFEQAILRDLARLNIVGDQVTYTSDSFPRIADYARQLIREGNGYMDNTSQEQMREERMHGIESVNRNMSPEVALDLFEKMLLGHPDADGYCLRGKVDMQAKNKTLRDPVFFRTNSTPHHRTGTKYKAYPTYDFACPIVDSDEGVTHALRTTEYNDRDAQYYWVLDALKLRKVRIHSFARMNFVHSVLSKRKLQWFVDQGIVEGWYDPRFPTVQGVLRRGVTVDALREFILTQGASRRMVDMEWDKFWTINKRVIDPIAPRFFALDAERAVRLNIHGLPFTGVQGFTTALHPKNAELGNTVKRLSANMLIERDDAELFTVGEDVTLMRYGNVTITAINKNSDGEIISVDCKDHPEGDFKKTKLKITWLAQVDDVVPATLVEFDHLISKPKLEDGDNFIDHLTPVTRAEMHAIGDHGLRNLQYGDIIQLERRGYFRVDSPYVSKDKPLVLFMIPDGKQRAMSTLSTNLAHR